MNFVTMALYKYMKKFGKCKYVYIVCIYVYIVCMYVYIVLHVNFRLQRQGKEINKPDFPIFIDKRLLKRDS